MPQVTECSLPTCQQPATGKFRETSLCKTHLEIAKVWEFCFGGPVRLPTMAELKHARGARAFAEYAVDYFLTMNLKYGAVDFGSGSAAGSFRTNVNKIVRAKGLKIWTFQKGADRWDMAGGMATVYLVSDGLPDNTHDREEEF